MKKISRKRRKDNKTFWTKEKGKEDNFRIGNEKKESER
jgi:hypothetical protein